MSDKLVAKGLSHLLARLEIDGVASVRVKDGQVFAFSRKKLTELLEAAEKSDDGSVIVFVKTGQEITEGGEN